MYPLINKNIKTDYFTNYLLSLSCYNYTFSNLFRNHNTLFY